LAAAEQIVWRQGIGQLLELLWMTAFEERIGTHYCPVISPTASAGYDHPIHSFRTVSL